VSRSSRVYGVGAPPRVFAGEGVRAESVAGGLSPGVVAMVERVEVSVFEPGVWCDKPAIDGDRGRRNIVVAVVRLVPSHVVPIGAIALHPDLQLQIAATPLLDHVTINPVLESDSGAV